MSDTMTIERALKLIAVRCPNLMMEAMSTLAAPLRTQQMRYNWLAQQAARECSDWTDEEREGLIGLVNAGYEPPLPVTVTARVTTDEYEAIATAADASGQTMSAYVREVLVRNVLC